MISLLEPLLPANKTARALVVLLFLLLSFAGACTISLLPTLFDWYAKTIEAHEVVDETPKLPAVETTGLHQRSEETPNQAPSEQDTKAEAPDEEPERNFWLSVFPQLEARLE